MHFKTSAGATNSSYSLDLHLLCVPRLLSTVSFCLVLKLLLLLGVLLPFFTSILPRNSDVAAVRGHFTGLSLALAALLLLPNDCVFRASPVLPAGLNGSLAIPSSSRDTCRPAAAWRTSENCREPRGSRGKALRGRADARVRTLCLTRLVTFFHIPFCSSSGWARLAAGCSRTTWRFELFSWLKPHENARMTSNRIGPRFDGFELLRATTLRRSAAGRDAHSHW